LARSGIAASPETEWPILFQASICATAYSALTTPQLALVFFFDARGKMVSRTLKNLTLKLGSCRDKSM
jgi:hypothetical protein